MLPIPDALAGLPAGGDEGNRTLDPLLAGQVLSQLSYTPIKMSASVFSMNFTACAVLDH